MSNSKNEHIINISQKKKKNVLIEIQKQYLKKKSYLQQSILLLRQLKK